MTRSALGPARFFLCRTPLQSLIIQRIQALSPGRDTVLYCPTSASEKHISYFRRLKGEKTLFQPHRYPLNSHIVAEVYEFLAIPSDVGRARYDEMYVASIGSLSFAALAGRNPNASLRTFDDGTFNVRRSHFESWIDNEGPPHHRMVWRLLSALPNREILARAERHYTIFDPSLALFPEKQIIKIDLFPEADQTGQASRRDLVVVFGTPIHIVAPDKAERYRQYVRSLAPDVYIPHPAEIDVPAYATSLEMDAELTEHLKVRIAEEIVSLLRRRGHPLTIHGFCSTALTNVAGMGKVSNHFVKADDPVQRTLFASFGIPSDCPL